MKVSVRLPLTLAIMDGMSVGVGEEVYILPLSSVVESFQVKGDDVTKQARKIADYIAGMTDRYAIREHRRLYSLDEL